jgi:ribosomal protein S6E (S10)
LDAALLIAAGFLVVFLNLWLIPKREGFQKRYAQRGVVIGAVLVVVGLVRATS